MKEGEKIGLISLPGVKDNTLRVIWEPKEDITPYELAKCMTLLLQASKSFVTRWMLPDDESVLRHFKIEEQDL